MANSRTEKTVHKAPTRKPAARNASGNHGARVPAAASASPVMSVEQRAFEIYSKRVSTGAPGSELSDWLQAESELRSDEE